MSIHLEHDIEIAISVADSRYSTSWTTGTILLSALYERLQTPARGTETLAEYRALPKREQDRRKDVGGFVGGVLKGPRRKADSVESRSLITLDEDNLPPDGPEIQRRTLDDMGTGYLIYPTRKDCPEAPRRRVIIPTNRSMTVDEYGAVSRYMAAKLNMAWADPTTFEPSRLMYWPSCCADSDYQVWYKDAPALNVDAILASYTLIRGEDWHDVSCWPKHPAEKALSDPQRRKKQENPTEKKGAIGAFCGLYPFERVLSEIIPGTYEPTSTEGRFTYVNGTTTGGAIVYDDGLFLQSYHSTDPANGMHNMFDLIRLHKYGELDSAAAPDTPGSQMPSYKAALEYIKSLPDVQAELSAELAEEAKEAFAPFVSDGEPDSAAFDKLVSFAGQTISLEIVRTALTACGYSIRTNLITNLGEVTGLPRRFSAGNSLNTLPIVLKDVLKAAKIKGVNDQAIDGYLRVIADEGRFNPVCDMLKGTPWDGTDRLPGLFEILGLSDSFDKTLVRKWLIQGVAMAFNDETHPVGAEGVLTLQGEQGIGKTEFFRRLAVDPAWFEEGLSLDMSNKDSIIRSISCWICELGELDSTTRREQSALKGHLTAATDNVRAPYARAATRAPRRTSFCATVNPDAFLTDPTGNRRYWVIPVHSLNLPALLSLDRAWIGQLWAQIYTQWEADPAGFRLTQDERETLIDRNKQFETFLPGEEEIRQLLQVGFETIPVAQWTPWSAAAIRRRLAWNNACGNLTTQQIGRALSRIRQDYPDIQLLSGHNHLTQYLLPLPVAEAPK